MRTVKPIFSTALIAAALLAVLPTAGCDGRQQAPAAAPVPEVVTVTVQPQPVMLTTELTGRTAAYRTAEIRPQVNGLIQKRLFVEGADVKAGDVLYQIDPASFKAALSNAKAALGRSEASLPAISSKANRYRELLAEKAVSQQDYDDAAAAMKQAESDIEYWKAMVETARINLDYTLITAPISGRIGRSSVTEGAIVTAYQPLALATIQQLDPIYVDVPQATAELLELKQRLQDGNLSQNAERLKEVKLMLQNNKAYPLEGTLQFRDVTVDPTTGSVVLRAVFPNPDKFLLPGMFVRAILKEGINEHAILIPLQAVSRDLKGNPAALIVDADSKVRQRPLSIDRALNNHWLVSSGLEQGDQVIIEGIQKARPGALVKTVPSKTGSPANDPKAQKTAQTAQNIN